MKKASFLLLCLVLIGGVSACGNTVESNENPDQVFTDVVEEYATEISVEATMCADTLDTLSEKFFEMAENLGLWVDSDYLTDLHADIDDFELYCTNFYDENAPAGFSEINNILNEVDINYLQAAIHMRSGVDTMNADKLFAAIDYMDAGTEKLNEASELAENMNQSSLVTNSEEKSSEAGPTVQQSITQQGQYLVPEEMQPGQWSYKANDPEDKCWTRTFSDLSGSNDSELDIFYSYNKGFFILNNNVRMVELTFNLDEPCTWTRIGD